MAVQEVQSSTPPLSNVRPQDLIVDFLRTQTVLSIRLSENLQDLSRDLLERVRKVMANKIPLDGSFNNCSIQTIFQLSAAIGSGCLQMKAIRLGSLSANLAATIIPPDRVSSAAERATYEQQVNLKINYDSQKQHMDMASGLVQGISQAASTYLKGNEQTFGFNAEELNKFHQENATCQNNVRSSQDALASLVRQITSHS